jgi:hypothetical protein
MMVGLRLQLFHEINALRCQRRFGVGFLQNGVYLPRTGGEIAANGHNTFFPSR